MAVQARQQFLDNPSMLCSGDSSSSALGWTENRAVVFHCSPPLLKYRQQQQQHAMTMLGRLAFGNQQLGAVAVPCSSSSIKIKMKEHLVSLMRKLELKASGLLRQKEEELARADKRTAELEEYLRRVEAEGQAWQRIGRENEAMALSLKATLKQVGENACPSTGIVECNDAASCCDSSSSPPVSNGSAVQEDRKQGVAETSQCRGCGSLGSCMLFMPCMHLCACKLCDTIFGTCPVCGCVKHGSIEVFY